MSRGHFLFLFLLPWGYSFCHGHESFSFCREVFLFALRFFFLLTEVFLFALRLILFPWQSAGPPYLRNSVHKILDVFVRTSTNFAHLVSFHYWLAIEFVDWPIPKTLDIFVCQTSENKAFKTQHSVTVLREQRWRTRFNLIPSLHAFR